MERFEYPVCLEPAPEGGYVVTCRDLPALITQGDSLDEALDMAADAMDEVFAIYMADGRVFPPASDLQNCEYLVSPPPETVAKAALHSAMHAAAVTNAQLARRLGVDEKEVRRLLDPHHGSKLPRIAEAVRLLGQRLVIGLEAA